MADRVLEKKFLDDYNKDGGLDTISKDVSGNSSFNGIFGSKLVASRRPYLSSSFFYPVRNNRIRDKSINLGSLSYDNNLFVVNSGASTSSSGYVETKDIIRYRAGRDAEAMFTAIFDNPVEGSNQHIGVFSENDGFYLGYNDNTFMVCHRKGGVDNTVLQSDFNIDKLDGTGESDFVLNKQNINIYRINYGYLGIAPAVFSIYAGYDKGWVPFHAIDLSNKQNVTHVDNPYLPLACKVSNTTNNTNVNVKIGSIYAGVFDGDSGNTPDSTSREESARVAGTTTETGETTVLTVHNKDLFQGKSNYIKSILLYLSATTDGNKAVTLSVKKLATTPTGGTWTDVRTNESILEYSEDATVDLTGAELLFPKEMSKVDSYDEFVSDLNLSLYPDEYAVFTLTSTQVTTYTLSIRESERF